MSICPPPKGIHFSPPKSALPDLRMSPKGQRSSSSKRLGRLTRPVGHSVDSSSLQIFTNVIDIPIHHRIIELLQYLLMNIFMYPWIARHNQESAHLPWQNPFSSFREGRDLIWWPPRISGLEAKTCFRMQATCFGMATCHVPVTRSPGPA